MQKPLLAALLALSFLSGCRREPPVDWSSPLGMNALPEAVCAAEAAGDVTMDQTDVPASTAGVRLINDHKIAGAIETPARR